MTATKIQPGNDIHLTLLMAPHSLNFVTGADRAALLAYGRDVFAAARDSKCLDQIEEPAQPVAEICSASHDDAEFGERAIKPLRDISGFDYGTPLYAGAAPAAVPPQGVVAWMTPEGNRVVTAETMDGARKDGGASLSSLRPYTVALVRGAAAPALEAPAAPATSAQVQALHRARRALHAIGKTYDESELRTRALEADDEIDRMLAAAPQAPAAPAGDEREAFEAWVKKDGGDLSTFGSGQNRHYNNSAVNNAWTGWCSRAALAAPAAPAVDALDADRWRALEGQMDAGRVSLTVHHTEAEQWDGRTISDAGELQDYADSLAAQAAAKGEHDAAD